MNKNKLKLIILLFASVFIVSCGGTSTQEESFTNDDFSVPDSIVESEAEPLAVSEQAMDDIISNISSPIEMAALIKESGAPIKLKILNNPDFVDNYNTSFKQALNLGIYGADLGYLNMYNQTSSVLSYISAIKNLADHIQVGQFFDFNTLKRLATNNSNLDSLMYISVSSFDQMDVYLRENNRSNISALIVTGVWLEGAYLATQVVKDKPSKEIAERIGEQKLVLNDILLILNNYKRDKKFFDFAKEIEKIKDAYKDVTITYEVGEPEAVEVDGVLTIVQNEKSIVNITDEQLANITKVVEEVRNSVIK